MTKTNLWLSLILLLAVATYAFFFTGWFRPETLVINYSVRKLPLRHHPGTTVPLVTFIINGQIRLNEIKVVPGDGFKTNQNIVPLWHLVSDSNSVPLKTFVYGQTVRGMRPAIPGVKADSLATNVTYRLLVTAGRLKGEHDFEIK